MVFISSTHFTLQVLVEKLTDNYFKYLSQEFRGDLMETVKQKGVYPYEYMDSLIGMSLIVL